MFGFKEKQNNNRRGVLLYAPTKIKKMRSITTIILITIATASFARVLSINPTQTNAQWHNVLNNLQAGDTVFLEDGTYTNFQVDIRGNGTATNPILVRARNYGAVKIEGAIRVRMSGSFITVDGFHFRNGWANDGTLFQFRTSTSVFASDCRLTNSVFDSLQNPAFDINNDAHRESWIGLYAGNRNRIDHNYFGHKMVYGVIIFVDPRGATQTSPPSNHIIERNFFGHRPSRPDNGAETMRIGDSERSMWSVGCTIRENVFFRTDGEIEVISIKSGDNLVEGNLFFEARGQVTCRHGHRNTIRNNVFIGNGVPNTSGVRVINSDQKVYNNWFQDLRGTGMRSALSVIMGLDPSCPLNSYYQVINAEIAYNTFINCQRIEIGTNVSTNYTCAQNQGVQFAPTNSRFRNNIIFNNYLSGAAPINVAAVGRDTGVTYENNLFRILSTTWVRQGFSQRPTMEFVRNGLFYELVPLANTATNPMSCIPILTGGGGIPEMEAHLDVTGNPRLRPYTAGAINSENFGIPPKIPNLDEVGVRWYSYPQPIFPPKTD